MLYAFICTDKPGTLEKRLAIRPEHLARLKELESQSRLILAGPHPAVDNSQPGEAGYTGSLIVAEFNNLEDAEAWAATDPFIVAGIYENITVKPFVQALPNPE